jgi:hypothetical protein
LRQSCSGVRGNYLYVPHFKFSWHRCGECHNIHIARISVHASRDARGAGSQHLSRSLSVPRQSVHEYAARHTCKYNHSFLVRDKSAIKVGIYSCHCLLNGLYSKLICFISCSPCVLLSCLPPSLPAPSCPLWLPRAEPGCCSVRSAPY